VENNEKKHLRDIAYARSGDKGSSANIGIIAYDAKGYEYLLEHLTAEKVQAYFKPLGATSTVRYELPNLLALNFVLAAVLDGGGSRSLRIDSQGKVLGQALLEMEI
jgi:hypothetical protein